MAGFPLLFLSDKEQPSDRWRKSIHQNYAGIK
jgi:hypothetical protein